MATASPGAPLQYRVLRAFKKAGLNAQRARGVLAHGFRHTATELANADVSAYTLMKLLGHESVATSQRYVDGAGTQNRDAAAQNPAVRPDRTAAGAERSGITHICQVGMYYTAPQSITHYDNVDPTIGVGHHLHMTMPAQPRRPLAALWCNDSELHRAAGCLEDRVHTVE